MKKSLYLTIYFHISRNVCTETCLFLFFVFLSTFVSLRDKIATGSFDKTCKLWSAETGKCFYTFRGHTAEIVRLTLLKSARVCESGFYYLILE